MQKIRGHAPRIFDFWREKVSMAKVTNREHMTGTLADAVKGADVFFGMSAPQVLTAEMVSTMAKDPMVFAMANAAASI